MNSKLKIFFLNGPMKSESVVLPLGPFKLGEDGDVWARFESKTPNLQLEVQQREEVRFLLNLPCWINGVLRGVSEEARKSPLPLRTPIDLDGLGFLILQQQDTVETLPNSLLSLPPRQSATEAAAQPQAPSMLERLLPVYELIKNLGWLTLVGAVGGWFAWKKVQQSKKLEFQKQQLASKKWLETQLKQPEYHWIEAEFMPNSRIELKGRCRTSASLQALIQYLKRQKWFVRSQVYCDDELVQNVLYTLKLFGFESAQAFPGDNLGSVIIQGEIEGNEQWQRVESFLSELPGLKSWNVSNPRTEQLESLIEALQEADLQSKLDVIQKGERFLLTGRTSETEEQSLKEIFDQFQKQYPEVSCIYQNIKPALQQEEIWPAPIVSIGGSQQHPFIELSNGARLQIGSQLSSGYQIIDIDERGIRLMKKNKLINVPLDLTSPYLA